MGREYGLDLILNNLEKELTVYCYDYETDEVKQIEDKVRLWSFIVMMYVLYKNIPVEKLVKKLESIIKHPKILIVFMKSLNKIFYIWLKDYDWHCKLLIKLYPELYSPRRLLMFYGMKASGND
jgi:hypothetical protein